eukprot:jgi/Botrbrau1/1641/Bobra.0185s0051.1
MSLSYTCDLHVEPSPSRNLHVHEFHSVLMIGSMVQKTEKLMKQPLHAPTVIFKSPQYTVQSTALPSQEQSLCNNIIVKKKQQIFHTC